jgi:hypothetical protein
MNGESLSFLFGGESIQCPWTESQRQRNRGKTEKALSLGTCILNPMAILVPAHFLHGLISQYPRTGQRNLKLAL